MASHPRVVPVILCGGAGTRLWPVSRKSSPKQFKQLLGDTSLLQDAALRVRGDGFDSPLVVTAEPFHCIVSEQLEAVAITLGDLLVKPKPRNTAPAVLAAALWCAASGPNALILVMPLNHQIPDGEAFRDAVAAAIPAAQSGKIVNFGVTPNSPETGYGYLELAEGVPLPGREPVPLRGFVEKPGLAGAQQMLESGNYLWNAGIFLFSADAILQAHAEHAPDMLPL